MATEEKRILKMAYLLLQSNGYLKAGDLARELNLSERTIKNDIEHLRVFLKECGCTLDSVRGKGYILQIDEPDQFAKIREWLNILFNNVENNTRERLSYQLARAIMCRQATDEDGYFLLDELAAQLYCSSSTVKKKMTWVREFLKSFGISLISRPSHGMKLCGDEFSQRLCMLELYENHFRIRVVAFNNQVYERAFRDRGDKDKVRKTVLDTIRASENELFDTYINRLVDYVLLLRNRIQSGNLIEADSERWSVYRKKLPLSKEWTLAVKLLENLKNISGYLQDISNVEGEIAALASLFLMWGDWEQMPELKKRFSIFYTKAKNLTEQVVENLKEQWKVPDEISNSQLVTALIPGLPTGTYIRYGRENYADEKGLILNSDGRICGSGSWVLRNIKQLVTKVGVPVEQAFYMASINPARYLGIDGETGSLQSGKRADMIFVNDDFVCERTFVGGKEVYNKNVDTPDKIFNTEALKAKVN